MKLSEAHEARVSIAVGPQDENGLAIIGAVTHMEAPFLTRLASGGFLFALLPPTEAASWTERLRRAGPQVTEVRTTVAFSGCILGFEQMVTAMSAALIGGLLPRRIELLADVPESLHLRSAVSPNVEDEMHAMATDMAALARLHVWSAGRHPFSTWLGAATRACTTDRERAVLGRLLRAVDAAAPATIAAELARPGYARDAGWAPHRFALSRWTLEDSGVTIWLSNLDDRTHTVDRIVYASLMAKGTLLLSTRIRRPFGFEHVANAPAAAAMPASARDPTVRDAPKLCELELPPPGERSNAPVSIVLPPQSTSLLHIGLELGDARLEVWCGDALAAELRLDWETRTRLLEHKR